jgi:hypothetical protein
MSKGEGRKLEEFWEEILGGEFGRESRESREKAQGELSS